MTVKFANRAGLPEMLDTQWNGSVACDRAEPGQRGRMPVNDGDQVAMRRQVAQQGFHRRLGIRPPPRPRALRRCCFWMWPQRSRKLGAPRLLEVRHAKLRGDVLPI